MKRASRSLGDSSDREENVAALGGNAEAERRQLTVMFCDLVGSTSLSTELDPEDFREVVRTYQHASAEVIQDLGGHVAQFLGDGLLVYFGFPVAYEDSADRAVRSGLGVLAAIERLNAGLRWPRQLRVEIRIGAHTGPVVIGEIGTAGRYERLALGETPNVAARIQGLAEPGTLVLSAATHQLVQGRFRCQDLGPHRAKGIEAPIRIFRVLAPEEPYRQPRAAADVRSLPLIGREQESDLLLRCWERAREGHGLAVLLSGEAGMGKSRLVEALHQHAIESPEVRWSEVRCSSLHRQVALHPLIDHLQHALGPAGTSMAEEGLRRLEAVLRDRGESLVEILPVLASLLGFPASEKTSAVPVSPQKQRQDLQEALIAWLLGTNKAQPLLLIWEDLHWIDPSTLEVLHLLVERIQGLPVLLVMSCRPDLQPVWAGSSPVVEIPIKGLNSLEAGRLIAATAGGKPLPPVVARQLIARADGVPLFLEELTRMVLESEWLREAEDHYELTGPLPSLVIPSRLQDSLMARLDRLGTVRAVVQMAATLGREFTHETLCAVSPVDEALLERSLDQLVEAQILDRKSDPPQVLYSFTHALIQEAAYDSLLKTRRQQFHSEVAELLENRPPVAGESASRLALLAHHWSRALDPQQPDPALARKAVGYLRAVGGQQLLLSAYPEALGHLEEALRLVALLPESRDRSEEELAIQVWLSNLLKATRGWGSAEVKSTYERARGLCRELGDRAELAQILFGLWSYHLWHGEYERSRELAWECHELAVSVGDAVLTLEAHSALSSTLFWLGELPEALRHACSVLALFEPESVQDHRAGYGLDPRMVALQFSINILELMGESETALRLHEEMSALSEELSHPFSTAVSLLTSVEFHRRRSEPQAVVQGAERLIGLSRDLGFPSYQIAGQLFLNWALAAMGEAETAVDPIRRSYDRFAEVSGQVALVHGAVAVAEVYAWAGRIPEALDLLADGLARARRSRELAYEAELHCLRGELLCRLWGESRDGLQAALHRADAETAFRQALYLAGQRWQLNFARRAAPRLAGLLEHEGRAAEALAVTSELKRLNEEIPRAVRRLLDEPRGRRMP
ncbi:MAG TPA: AAA family ATPase [Thermoanaerobaculia bacterium]|nr:AAA family ATPase [Thermoanaerobaculia bacterium]